MDELIRTKLLTGKDSIEKLSNSKVIIFGLGGVGGYTAEALARSGVGELHIVDNDKISLSNINRQIYALHSTVGVYKTQVAKQRILDINSNIKVNTYEIFFSDETADSFDFSQFDYIVDAIDTVKSKVLLALKAKEANKPIISSMGTGNKLNPCLFEVEDIYKTSYCPLAKVMRNELKKRNIDKLKVVYSKEIPVKPLYEDCNINQKNPPGSCAFVPPVAGLIIAGEVFRYLTNCK